MTRAAAVGEKGRQEKELWGFWRTRAAGREIGCPFAFEQRSGGGILITVGWGAGRSPQDAPWSPP